MNGNGKYVIIGGCVWCEFGIVGIVGVKLDNVVVGSVIVGCEWFVYEYFFVWLKGSCKYLVVEFGFDDKFCICCFIGI